MLREDCEGGSGSQVCHLSYYTAGNLNNIYTENLKKNIYIVVSI